MRKVRDLMARDVVTVSPDLTLRTVTDLLAGRHLGGAPVVAGSRVVGVVSASDILSFQASTPAVPAGDASRREWELEPADEWIEGDEAPGVYFGDHWTDAGADVVERFAETRGPEWDLLAEHTVAEVMSRRVASVGPDASLRVAARRMAALNVHRLLVLEAGRLAGVLSASDVVRAVGEGRV